MKKPGRKVKPDDTLLRKLQGGQSRIRQDPSTVQILPHGAYSFPAQGQSQPIQASPSVRKGSIFEAIPRLVSSLEKNEGYRIGVLGESGAGKSSAIKHFLRHPFNGITLIHDEKAGPVQFEGAQTQHASLRGLPGNCNTVVFRGDPFAGTRVEVNSVALLALKLARLRIPVRLVIDELDRAVSDGGRVLSSPAVRECITQGRAMGLCVLWSTQLPQRAPVEMLDNASAIVLGRCGPRAINYLDSRCFFTPDITGAIAGLRTHYEDNKTVGELVVHRNGKPWDGTVYTNE